MTCREIVEFLMRYLDGELPPEQAAVFAAHLGDCPQCEAYLETYRQTVQLSRLACAARDEEAPCADMPEALVRAVVAASRKGLQEELTTEAQRHREEKKREEK